MWLNVERGQERLLVVHDRQAVWPASELSDAELVMSLRAELEENVLLATNQVIRITYRIADLESTFSIDGSPPERWQEATAIKGRSFELMVTGRSAMCVPAQGPKLPNRLASWMSQVAEDVRAIWPPLPEALHSGATWSVPPIVPGGLPPHTASVSIDIGYRAGQVGHDAADVEVKFGLSARIEDPHLHANAAVGEGTLTIHLERQRGPCTATRTSLLTLVRPQTRNQLVRSAVEVSEKGSGSRVPHRGQH